MANKDNQWIWIVGIVLAIIILPKVQIGTVSILPIGVGDEQICIQTGGDWRISSTIPTTYKCICPKETYFEKGIGCRQFIPLPEVRPDPSIRCYKIENRECIVLSVCPISCGSLDNCYLTLGECEEVARELPIEMPIPPPTPEGRYCINNDACLEYEICSFFRCVKLVCKEGYEIVNHKCIKPEEEPTPIPLPGLPPEEPEPEPPGIFTNVINWFLRLLGLK